MRNRCHMYGVWNALNATLEAERNAQGNRNTRSTAIGLQSEYITETTEPCGRNTAYVSRVGTEHSTATITLKQLGMRYWY